MTVREKAYEIAYALQRRLLPELQHAQAYYEEHLRRHAHGARSWLDIGCGHNLLPAWRFAAEKELVATVPLLVGVDYDYDSLRKHGTIRNVVRANISALPLRDRSFDLVTANMVVEHLDDPVRQFCEVARVLQPGGVFLLHTPNLRGYVTRVARRLPSRLKKVLAQLLEGRPEEDVYPTHYRANTGDAIREVATRAGLEVHEIHFTMSSPVFALVPPLAALELLYLRRLMRRPELVQYRQTIICALRRPVE